MKIGFVKSKKENEKRVAIVFSDIKKIKNRKNLYFEKGYFNDFGIKDCDIEKIGCNVVNRNDVLKCDVICDPKVGDAEYIEKLNNQIIFGWIHATQNKEITDMIMKSKLTCFAWEKMFEGNSHVFYKNNEIAGQASVLHALINYGSISKDMVAGILGDGNTSRGAQEILKKFGIRYKVYTRKEENIFKNEFDKYDIIVNAVLWDPLRKDHIIYKEDLKKLRKSALIIDISCDHNGAIESCTPTSIQNPTYECNGIKHYAVDHSPSLLYKDASEEISKQVVKYIDLFIEDKEECNNILSNSLIIKNGKILDEEIVKYQGRG